MKRTTDQGPRGNSVALAEQVALAHAELSALRSELRHALRRLDATIAHLAGSPAPPDDPPRRGTRTRPPPEPGRAKRVAPSREPGARGRRAPVLPGKRSVAPPTSESPPEAKPTE